MSEPADTQSAIAAPLRRAVGEAVSRLARIPVVARARAPVIRSGPATGMRMAVPAWLAEQYLDGEYEPDVTEALARLVRPGDVCADLGAHIGYFTLVLAALAGEDGRVLAFEAAPDNFARLRDTVAVNRLGRRVEVEHAAVGRPGGASLELFAGRQGGSSEWTTSRTFAERDGDAADERRVVRVPSVSLDERLSAGARLDVVKMDIEGAEADAVPGMSRILAELRPSIVLEFHREVGWPAIPALVKAGYRFETLAGEPLPEPGSAADVPYQLVARPA